MSVKDETQGDACTKNIKLHQFTTPYHPRTNGVPERSVCSLKVLLPKILEGKTQNCDDYLSMVQWQLNIKVSALHSLTLFSLFYGHAFAGLKEFSNVESHPLSLKFLAQLSLRMMKY